MDPWVDVRAKMTALEQNLEAYVEDGPEWPYTVVGENYIVYEVMPNAPESGTLVKHGTEIEAQEALRAQQSLQPVRYINNGISFPLVFRGVYIGFDDWVRRFSANPIAGEGVVNIVGRQLSRGNRPNFHLLAGERVLNLLRQITKPVRKQFLGGQECFVDLRNSIGITENDEVVYLKGPQGGMDFMDNTIALDDIAKVLVDCLTQLAQVAGMDQDINPTINILQQFHNYIGNRYFWWMTSCPQFDADQRFNAQMFALFHPATLDEDEHLRLFTNLGRLADESKGTPHCLCSNNDFKQHITFSKIKWWMSDVASDPGLYGVLHFSRTYKREEIPIFCENSMKHHWEHVKALSLSKKEVIQLLCQHIDGLANEMFTAYSRAVMHGGYTHKYSAKYIMTEDV
ncbi:PREDICTED: uncharacterized protein LOC101300281 [Fragaria vesca subsp. vesca]|uniref:uncharacterized protein LOC101300281 n=1 Tax=Fragaria vesca subsp. vesca TaxID=101020 RepID=UPI0002C2F286|nr:PREDICTED: uncharacterized protein LOC101300281 [Fragaria vesca subsp. vesca]